MKFCIDFDGTLATHEYPKIGVPLTKGFQVLKELQENGHELILWTMRSGQPLAEAIEFCKERGVMFDSINEGIGDREWTSSPKAHAHFYIDDAAMGCPLIDPQTGLTRPFVDWHSIETILIRRGILRR